MLKFRIRQNKRIRTHLPGTHGMISKRDFMPLVWYNNIYVSSILVYEKIAI